MKARVLLFTVLLVIAGILTIVFLPPSRPSGSYAASKAAALHKWLTAYALDHDGAFPRSPKELDARAYGIPDLEEYTSNIIEYRGAALNTSSAPASLLMRFSITNHTELEGRTYVSGRTIVRPKGEFGSSD
jgi:hypothetical protein